MEYDRYQHNKILFIISITSLVIGLSLLAFSLFILPNLIWALNYDVPTFIYIWSENLKENYNFTITGAHSIVFLIFFIPAILAIFIAYLTSNIIDNKLYGFSSSQREFKTRYNTKETILIVLQLLLILGLVIVVIYSLY